MATNPYFNFRSTASEQNLIEDLTIEAIKTMGMDVIYLPRDFVKKDNLFGEDILSKFTSTYEIEMYLQSVDGFDGEGDILAKYGLEIKDKVSLVVSQRRFRESVGDLANITRPREGDLIYFPMGNYLFEINFVEHENPFYQLGKNQTYLLQCELFTYSLENIQTGLSGPNAVQDKVKEYAQVFTLGSVVGSTSDFYRGETLYQVAGVSGSSSVYADATATATVIDWSRDSLELTISSDTGTFLTGANQTVKGRNSAAEYTLTTIASTNLVVPENIVTDKPDGDNSLFGLDSQGVIDFTEVDPFSEGLY